MSGFKLPKRSRQSYKISNEFNAKKYKWQKFVLSRFAMYCLVKLPANSIEKLLKLPDERLR